MNPYRILLKKRAGESLGVAEIEAIAAGAASGSWGDAELAAFLMAAAIRGLDTDETAALTRAMLESGEQWRLGDDIVPLTDKHSTGGVGDKVSLILGPLLAACGVPVVMLTGRGLGHTGGTADKLESLPGLDLELTRSRTKKLLEEQGLAIGVATTAIAPADRRLYQLRDRTATVNSLPLVISSILSKKLAAGASALVLDVKTGSGAFFPDLEESRDLAQRLVEVARSLGCRASALVTDMSQPLGRWVGHAAEVAETVDCLEGRGEARLMEVTLRLCEEILQLVGSDRTRDDLEAALTSGAARQKLSDWAIAQGADSAFMARPSFDLAPLEESLVAARDGVVSAVDTRQLGLLLAESGHLPGGEVDFGVALKCEAQLGDRVKAGDEMARLYLRRADASTVAAATACYVIGDEGEAPPLIHERVG